MHIRQLPALLITLTFTGSAYAQAPSTENSGFFSFVNIVSLPGKTSLSIDGRDMKPEGFTPGEVTGGIGLPVGSHVFTVTCGDCKPVSVTVPIVRERSPIVLAYAQDLPPDPQTGQIKHELKALALDNKPPGKKRTFYGLYIGAKPSIDLVINGRPQTIQRFQEDKISEKAEKDVVATQGDKTIVSFAPLDKGNFVVIFFDGPDGSLSSAQTHDVVYQDGGFADSH